MSNVGIGSFGGFYGGGNDMEAQAFYDRLGEFAEANGVMVNLVTIAGTQANI